LILAQLTRYISENGMTASLRRLAAAADVSPRLLCYYFDSRDGVLSAVLQALREEQSIQLTDAAKTRREAAERAWKYYTAPARELQVQLFFHLAARAIQMPGQTNPMMAAVVETWIDAFAQLGVQEGLSRQDATRDAQILSATTRGLLLDRLLTGDGPATDRAHAEFLDRILGPRPSSSRKSS
jgi:AcrR family transcriptional regulator